MPTNTVVGGRATCIKYVLCVFNFIFWCCGAVVFGLGIWLLFDKQMVSYLTVTKLNTTDPSLDVVAHVMIGAGAFMIVIGILGCCGTYQELECMLGLYLAFLVVVMVVQFVIGIMAVLYKQKVETYLLGSMQHQLRDDYGNNTVIGKAWEFVQTHLQCCGAQNSTDYHDTRWQHKEAGPNQLVPISCCVLYNRESESPIPKNISQCQLQARQVSGSSLYLNHGGCFKALSAWVKTQSIVFMVVACAVAGVQVVLLALLLQYQYLISSVQATLFTKTRRSTKEMGPYSYTP